MTKRIAVVLFDGLQLQSIAGPLSAFEVANRFAPDSYCLEPVRPHPDPVTTSVGIPIAHCSSAIGPFDTLLVPGGGGLQNHSVLKGVVDWLKVESLAARRIATVCTGAYVAAEAGLLDGLRATTHWDAIGHFSRHYPRIRLQPDQIVVRDGSIWTSAGVSSGIDLALAMIEEDLGSAVSMRVARQLVVPYRRQGGQLQYSTMANAEEAQGRFSELLNWIRDHLSEPMSVEVLADVAGMSPRNFARAFRRETGITPAKMVEYMRLEIARSSLEATRDSVEHIAEAVGFGDPERMRRAFVKAYGKSPQAHRRSLR